MQHQRFPRNKLCRFDVCFLFPNAVTREFVARNHYFGWAKNRWWNTMKIFSKQAILVLFFTFYFNYPVYTLLYRCSTTVSLEINFAGLTFAPRSKKPYWLANSWCVIMISAEWRVIAETLLKCSENRLFYLFFFTFYPILSVVKLDQSSYGQVLA